LDGASVPHIAHRVAAAIRLHRYRGTVDKFTGDGIMALFGAPAALEFHAMRACVAALDIQRENHPLVAEIDERDGVDLQLGIGVNSGRVIAGEIGSGRRLTRRSVAGWIYRRRSAM
jgi:adenylate cyclase